MMEPRDRYGGPGPLGADPARRRAPPRGTVQRRPEGPRHDSRGRLNRAVLRDRRRGDPGGAGRGQCPPIALRRHLPDGRPASQRRPLRHAGRRVPGRRPGVGVRGRHCGADRLCHHADPVGGPPGGQPLALAETPRRRRLHRVPAGDGGGPLDVRVPPAARRAGPGGWPRLSAANCWISARAVRPAVRDHLAAPAGGRHRRHRRGPQDGAPRQPFTSGGDRPEEVRYTLPKKQRASGPEEETP